MSLNFEITEVLPAFYAAVSDRKSDIWGQSLALEQGQRYAISGASGKGKSTFLNLLFGIRKVPNGHLHFGGRSLTEITPEERSTMRREQVSMVFQDLLLFDHLSARANLLLKHALHANIEVDTIWQWCEKLDIYQHIDRPCSQLSLGQQQRVAIVRALIQPFSWLLMDEPTSHLDKENAKLVYQLVDEVCAHRGAGTVITTLEKQPECSFDKLLFC